MEREQELRNLLLLELSLQGSRDFDISRLCSRAELVGVALGIVETHAQWFAAYEKDREASAPTNRPSQDVFRLRLADGGRQTPFDKSIGILTEAFEAYFCEAYLANRDHWAARVTLADDVEYYFDFFCYAHELRDRVATAVATVAAVGLAATPRILGRFCSVVASSWPLAYSRETYLLLFARAEIDTLQLLVDAYRQHLSKLKARERREALGWMRREAEELGPLTVGSEADVERRIAYLLSLCGKES